MVHDSTDCQSLTQSRWSRRGFLRTSAGAVASLGLSLPSSAKTAGGKAERCIFLFLVGGPSHLDTWDPKPGADASVRGPFRAIGTKVPGIHISELFPGMAQRMDRIALVRSLYHKAPAVHDTGHQLMQTGRLFGEGPAYPHCGCVAAALLGAAGNAPAHALLPGPIAATGGNLPHGQDAGFLGRELDPFLPSAEMFQEELNREPENLRRRYGPSRFGQSCLVARRMVERGTRFVTVNMYETVFNTETWDCHGSRPFTSMEAIGQRVAPDFDRAYCSLLDDLSERGLLDTTLVVALGEFGRSPRVNSSGGRDHHPGCWTGLFAGGPVRGGQVIGASDKNGYQPIDRPVSGAEVVASVHTALGLPLNWESNAPDGSPFRLVEQGVRPIAELFG